MVASVHPFDRPRWTEADARVVLSALARSGQSVREFAERHDLDPQRLYLWRRRVAGGDGTMFRELVVPPVPSTDPTFEVALPSGVKVRVPPSFDTETLVRLLEVLARTC
ncbi:MAG TPA: transposase [Polyangiaceae bacterium]|nr:transposase [Polyangiaceae bacterium]